MIQHFTPLLIDGSDDPPQYDRLDYMTFDAPAPDSAPAADPITTPLDGGPAPAPDVDLSDYERFHVTAVDRWLECGHREHAYETNRWRMPAPKPAQLRGRAVHEARRAYFRKFKKTKTEPTLEEVLDAANTKLLDDTKHLDPEEADPIVDKAYEDAKPYIETDHGGVLRTFAPAVIAVEKRITIPYEGPGLRKKYLLTGQLDVIGKDTLSGRLVDRDLKTGKAMSQVAANASTQLSLYGALVEAEYGKPPLHVLDSVTIYKSSRWKPVEGEIVVRLAEPAPETGKPRFGVQRTMSTERSPRDHDAALRKLHFVLSMREQEFYPPAGGGITPACHTCPHRGHVVESQRCEFASASRFLEKDKDEEEGSDE